MRGRRAGESMAVTKLSCRGCHRTVVADFSSAPFVRTLVAWTRDADGDWCVICQAGRAGGSELQRAVAATAAARRRAPHGSRWRELQAQQRRIERLDELAYRVLVWTLIVAAIVLIGIALSG
jgi:hypothetical protein